MKPRAAPLRPAALVLAAALLGVPACSQRGPEAPPQPAAAAPQSPSHADRSPASAPAPPADPERARQCDRFITVLEEQGQRGDPEGEDATAFRQLGDDAEEAARAVGAVDLTLPELIGYRDRMKQIFLDLTDAARQASAAMEAQDLARMSALVKALARTGRANAELVQEINAYCQGA